MAKTFFKKGFSDKPKMPKKKWQNRVWLAAPKEGSAPDPVEDKNTFIVLHEGEPIGFHEHQLKINGGWQNWFTCPVCNEIGDECPLCEHGEYRAYFCGVYTVLDTTPYPKKDGTTNRGTKKLLVCKSEMLSRFELWAADHLDDDGNPDLWGVEYRVYRTSSDGANIGDDWKETKVWSENELEEEFAEELEEDEDFLEALDYEDIFAVCSVEELEAIANLLPAKGSGGGAAAKRGRGAKKKRGARKGTKKGIDFD